MMPVTKGACSQRSAVLLSWARRPRRMPCMSYKPAPIDTSKVELSPEILKLTETLAKNTHEVWAKERVAQGWHYGRERNDERKEHPCLVPYEQLPESEKVFDRDTAMEALKAILALGYHISKP